MVDVRLVGHHLTVSWLYIRHRKPLRVLCNGKTSAFQADDTGSIPVTRSKNSFQTNCLQNPCLALGKYLINIDYCELKRKPSKLMTRVRFPSPAPGFPIEFMI